MGCFRLLVVIVGMFPLASGLAVSFGSFLAMSLDSTKELMNDRALVVPEYEEQSGRRRSRVKRFVMHPASVEGKESVQQNYIELEDQAEGGRLSAGATAGSAGAEVGKGKGD